jgi:hypothetical protein
MVVTSQKPTHFTLQAVLTFRSMGAMKLLAVLALACCLASGAAATSQSAGGTPAAAPGLLTRDKAGPLLPQTVFFDGKVATVQARNSAGIRLSSDKIILAALVDSSGYASDVRERYQGILLLTAPILIGGKRLEPGQYGFGFLQDDVMVVMNLGAGDVLRTSTTRDAALARPVPLQMISEADGTRTRLYLGRSYVVLQPVQ